MQVMCHKISSKIILQNEDQILKNLTIIGGGLAGCEAAYQAAIRRVNVTLYEMRPNKMTPAHTTGDLAEIICSNSFGSMLPDRSSGLLMDELRKLGSLLVKIAFETSVPAGGSLAVDRSLFSSKIYETLSNTRNIQIIRQELKVIPENPCIIASGPLTSSLLSESIKKFTGADQLFFYDALSPIILGESIDMNKAFWGSRFGKTKGQSDDYINCPMTKSDFEFFASALISAKRKPLNNFEQRIPSGVKAGKGKYFESCLPIEIIAERGLQSLTFGPLRPIGLNDPRTNSRPYAVVQLRRDDLVGSLFNLVGFQTNLLYEEQNRILKLIPGLENSRIIRYGQMHRNTYLSSPDVLLPTLQSKTRSDLFFAGQITGVEGYLGNIGTGLLAGINAANHLNGRNLIEITTNSMLGSLLAYVTNCNSEHFQPMKANFGILPSLDNQLRDRLARSAEHVKRASDSLDKFLLENSDWNLIYE
jgi:methylenetetrahydrofolate--tRNA-(uracil-5-)-methyltransferase